MGWPQELRASAAADESEGVMTTTQIDMPPRVGAPHPAETPAWLDPRRRSQHGKLVKWAVIATVALAGLAAGWMALRNLGRIDTSEAIITYKVQPRTFDVILSEKGELDSANKTEIKCEVEGRTRIIWLVPEGKQVEKGELLVKLASDQIDNRIQQESLKEAGSKAAYDAAAQEYEIQKDEDASRISKATLAVELAKLRLDKYLEGDWEQKKQDAEVEIEKAKTILERRAEEFEYSKALVEDKFITRTEYKTDEFEKFEAEKEMEKAELAKEILHKYTFPAEQKQYQSDYDEARKELARVIRSAEANLAKGQATVSGRKQEWQFTKQQLDKLLDQRTKCEINAPSNGFVVYFSEDAGWRNENRIAEGQEVYERQTILSLPDTSAMKVVVRIHEANTDKIKLDQQARVELEGFPGVQFTGKVTKIAAVADSRNRWLNPDLKEYRTEITLDGSRQELKPGVTARVEIFVERVENALAVPVQAVFSKAGKTYVFVERGRSAEPVEVQLGRSNNEFVEVLSGLQRGQEVRMAVDDSLKRKLPEAGNNGSGEAAEAWKAPPPAAGRRQPSAEGGPPGGQRRGDRRPMGKNS